MQRVWVLFAIGVSAAGWAVAEEAQVQTPAPVIHLKDNADEPQGLGWCLDTVGRGFSDRVHLHSCKPQGGDVQFGYDEESGLLRSEAFPDQCVSLDRTVFSLTRCESGRESQRFVYNRSDYSLRPASATGQCLFADERITSAGPFHSRALLLGNCQMLDAERKEWIVRSQ